MILCGLYGRFRRQGTLEYEVGVFLKGGRPPHPCKPIPIPIPCVRRGGTMVHCVFWLFPGARQPASQPASQPGGGGGGGFQSLPATQPRLGAAPLYASGIQSRARPGHTDHTYCCYRSKSSFLSSKIFLFLGIFLPQSPLSPSSEVTAGQKKPDRKWPSIGTFYLIEKWKSNTQSFPLSQIFSGP